MKRNLNKSKIFFILFIVVIECLYFKCISYIDKYNKLVILIIILNGFLLWILIVKNQNKENKTIAYIVFFSYLIRSIILIAKMYGFSNPLSGSDDEGFYALVLGKTNFSFFYYAQFVKLFVPIIGDSRYVLEYFNVIISIFSLFVFKKTLLLLLDKKSIIIPFVIFAFDPTNILLSATFLRETLMIFLNMLAIYFFVLWYKKNKVYYILLTCFFLFFSSYFHSGMFFGGCACILILVFYNLRTKKISIHTKGIINLVLAIAFLLLIFAIFGNKLTFYFNKVKNTDDITDRAAPGYTDYLTFLDGKNIVITFLFLPLKIFYFYISPMPWDCRSLKVLLTFLFSSTIYLYLFFNIFAKKSNDNNLKKLLLFILLSLSIVYSLGVKNAGTAMRHREKMMPFVITLYALTIPQNSIKKEEKKRIELINS